MKKLIITTVVFISIFGLVIFFWVKNKNDLDNKQTLIPSFSTPDLPSGKVGEYYQAELTGTLIGSKEKLEILGLQIPEWLKLSDCKQEYDVSFIPKPNTFISCQLNGYPTKDGNFDLSFEINAKGYYSNSIAKLELLISQNGI